MEGNKDSEGTIAELRRELTTERNRCKALTEELRQLKNEVVKLQAVAEQEDEARVNKLSKNLEQLKREKQDVLVQVEQEEEYIINSLGRRLEQVRKEKIEMENQLEQEEEFITNKLQKQLAATMNEKKNLEKRLEVELHEHEKLVKMEKEVNELRKQLKQYEIERQEYQEKNTQFKDELLKLKTDNFVLGQRIKREQEKLSRVSSEKLKLMSNLEMGDEKLYNTKGRHMNLRARSVSLPPRADVVVASLAAAAGSTPTTPTSTTTSPVHTPHHPHSISLPTTPIASHATHPHVSPRSPRARSVSPMQRGKLMKESVARIKGHHHESQQGWATLRDLGASSVLQVWRDRVQEHRPPDIVLDIDTLHPRDSSIEVDKVDPRCIILSHKEDNASGTQTNLQLTLIFETEELAAEWVALLNELRM